jgi:hypothetical protein
MKRVNLLAIVALSFGLSTLVSCNTDLASGADSTLTATAVDESQASGVSDQVVSSADDLLNNLDASGYQGMRSEVSSNPQKTSIKIVIDSVTITVDKVGLNDYPKNICLDFGTGVTVKRGNVLKGKIYITVTGKMSVANSSRTFQFSDFYVNDNAVKGKKVVTYMGLNADSKPYWTISASDTITRADGAQVIWNSERVRTRIDNNDTPLIYSDDNYAITGSSSGINAKGVAYTMTIQESNPLITSSDYKYFTKGTLIITTEKRTAVIDYGDGTKDNIATITIDGVTKEFTLKR